MSRGPRSAPALVVFALVGAAATVVWLAREDDDPTRERARAAHEATHARAPRVDLSPGGESPAAIAEAIERARAPGPGEGARTPEVTPAPRDEGGRGVDPPPSLRGVRGLVRDARTKAPIPGAWIAWRVPPPEVCDRVFSDPATLQGAGGLVTDAQGRFDVDRLPDDEQPSSTLTAVARGYAPASVRPGLREEVVLELAPSGSLEVVIDEPLDVVLELASGAAPARVALRARREADGRPAAGPLRWRVDWLQPGRWCALLDGREVAATDVVEGQTARLVISAPPWVEVEGTVLGADPRGVVHLTPVDGDPAVPGAGLVLADGRFAGSLWPGRYAVSLEKAASWSERRVPGVVEVVPGMPPLVLQVPPASERLEVLLAQDGQPTSSDGLGLVALDLPEDDPFGGDLVHLEPTGEPGVHAGSAAPGLYALFDGDLLLAPSVVLPAAGRLGVDRREATCRLRFALPPELRQDEVLRARVVLIPEVLARRPALRARFATQGHVDAVVSHASPSVAVSLGHPGRYLLVGESDLGPLEAWVDLTPGGEVTVRLAD